MMVLKLYVDKIHRLVKKMMCRIHNAYKCVTYPYYEYTDLESAAREFPKNIRLLAFKTHSSFCSYPTYYPEKETSVVFGVNVTIKRALIHNAKCFVYSDVILLSNNKILNELKDIKYYRDKIDFTDEVILRDKDVVCQLNCDHSTKTKKIPIAIKIGGMFGFNYYHFVYQLLPRMNYLDDIDSSVPLLLDASARDVSTIKQLVECANMQDRKILYMDYGYCYDIEDLYYITSPNIIAPNIKSKKFNHAQLAFFTSKSLEYLRDMLLVYKSTVQTPEYVFIARRKASKRRCFNEEECGEVLKKHGFVEIYPERLTLAEQIAIFNNAKIIVGATGAAFANMIFCNINTNVVILTNYKMPFPYFSSISSFVGNRVVYLFDTKLGVAPSFNTIKYTHRSFTIDTNMLSDVIALIKFKVSDKNNT